MLATKSAACRGRGNNSFEALYPAALRRLIERTAIIIHAQETIADDPTVHRRVQEAADRALEDAYLQHATAARVTEQMLLARQFGDPRQAGAGGGAWPRHPGADQGCG